LRSARENKVFYIIQIPVNWPLAVKKIALKTQKIIKRDAKMVVPIDKMLSASGGLRPP